MPVAAHRPKVLYHPKCPSWPCFKLVELYFKTQLNEASWGESEAFCVDVLIGPLSDVMCIETESLPDETIPFNPETLLSDEERHQCSVSFYTFFSEWNCKIKNGDCLNSVIERYNKMSVDDDSSI